MKYRAVNYGGGSREYVPGAWRWAPPAVGGRTAGGGSREYVPGAWSGRHQQAAKGLLAVVAGET
eukprot:1194635-Prorocentrum_minimum.AAC.1